MQLLSQHISNEANAKTAVLFGGNPVRRHEVVMLLSKLPGVSVYGALSEEEGLQMLNQFPKVDLVMIGGRYDDTQRRRIRQFVATQLPSTKLIEPGLDYPYSDANILADVQQKLGMLAA